MKLFAFLLAAFVAAVAATSTEDHEIFRIRDELMLHEGSNVTFYSFLGVKQSASLDDINKAYRKQSRLLHPDKARATWITNYSKEHKPDSKGKPKKPSQKETNAYNKEASARFARLGVITNILRGPDRQRYDHFLNNGFPIWRGTGYYYARFRPGLGSVLIGLFIVLGGGFHYLSLYLTYSRHHDYVEKLVKDARRKAWGDDSTIAAIPGLGPNGSGQDSEEDPQSMQWNRKMKRVMAKEKRKETKDPKKSAAAAEKARREGISTPQEAQEIGPVGSKKRTVADNGKILIVDSVGNVFLEETTEEGALIVSLVDLEAIQKPTIYDTALYRAPIWGYDQIVNRFTNKAQADAELQDLVNGDETPMEEKAIDAATSINANGEARKRKSKTQR